MVRILPILALLLWGCNQAIEISPGELKPVVKTLAFYQGNLNGAPANLPAGITLWTGVQSPGPEAAGSQVDIVAFVQSGEIRANTELLSAAERNQFFSLRRTALHHFVATGRSDDISQATHSVLLLERKTNGFSRRSAGSKIQILESEEQKLTEDGFFERVSSGLLVTRSNFDVARILTLSEQNLPRLAYDGRIAGSLRRSESLVQIPLARLR